jgi:L-ascorbate metabolism protein UlaG (beta-lactamase superfamily)
LLIKKILYKKIFIRKILLGKIQLQEYRGRRRNMIIRWHGHACFEISNGHTIVTDPHDGKSIGIKPPQVKADLTLVSHNHFDHNSVKTVNKTSTRSCSVPGKHREFDIEIKGIKAYHDNTGGEKRGEICIFSFLMDGISFCHLGDLGHILEPEQIKAIGKIDILFVPIGDVFTIGAQEAWKTITLLQPIVAIPMHYRVGGLSLSIQPLDPFLANAERIERVGNEIHFEREDLPESFEVWVFSL